MFVLVKNTFLPHIHLFRSIKQECPLLPYLYVLIADALDYLLESTCLLGHFRGVSLLDNSEMVNNHFQMIHSCLCEMIKIQFLVLDNVISVCYRMN